MTLGALVIPNAVRDDTVYPEAEIQKRVFLRKRFLLHWKLSSKEWNELPRSKLTGYRNIAMRIYPKASPPNVLIGGPVPVSPWIPDRSIRE
jgi:hypothetical protein